MPAAYHKITKEQKIGVLSLIVLTGFVCAVFFHYIQGMYRGLSSPYSTFLFSPEDKFKDYFILLHFSKGLDPYLLTNMSGAGMPPLVFLMLYPFLFIPGMLSLVVFNGIFIIFFAAFIYKSIFSGSTFSMAKIDGLICFLIMTFLSYPFLFLIDRGNIESISFIFLALFMFFYLKNKFTISAVFLSLAVLIKVFPIIFIILFLKDRKYKEAIITIIASIGIGLAGFSVLKGGISYNLPSFLKGFQAMYENYVAFNFDGDHVTRWSTSLYWLRGILYGGIAKMSMPIFTAYMASAFFAFAGVLFYIIRYGKRLWENIALITVLMIALPCLSQNYKLINLFLPLVLFINSKEDSKYTLCYLVLFGLLLIPKSYPLFFNGAVTLNIANPILLVMLAAAIIIEGIGAVKAR